MTATQTQRRKESIDPNEIHNRLEKCENLTSSKDLNLSDLGLSTIPHEIMRLSCLRTLNLRNNSISSLPIEFVETFPLLEVLNLAQNQLTHMPPDIGSLQKLKKCFVQSNQLKSLPLSLMSCSRLEELYVQHNKIQEIPEEFAQLTNLHTLSIAFNEIKTIPKSLEALTKLKVVDMTGNTLTEVPELLRRLHDRHSVLHSRERRRELISRALKIKSAVKQSLKNQAREQAVALSK